MANQFLKLRRSAVPGKIPSTSSIDFGEIALNTYDGLAFIKRSGSLGEEVITLGSREGAFTGSFSGSFIGNGGGLFNIPASGIVGLNLSQIATGSVSASVGVGASSFSVVSGSNTFLYVSSSGNVGIGTNLPVAPIQIGTTSTSPFGSPLLFMGRDQNAETNFQISNSTNGTSASVGFRLFAANGRSSIIAEYPSSFTNAELAGHLTIIPNSPGGGNKHGLIFAVTDANSGSDIMFYTQGLTSANKKAQIYNSTGNLILQNGGTFTDSGERLQVSGSSRFIGNMVITGSGNTSATNALSIVNSSNTSLLTLRNDGLMTIGDQTTSGLKLSVLGSYTIRLQLLTNATLDGITGTIFNSAIDYSGNNLILSSKATSTTSNIYIIPSSFTSFSGNVGIGTNAPSASLHISGSTGALFEIDSNTAQNILYVSSSGNVGINTNTPSYNLHVHSSIGVQSGNFITTIGTGLGNILTSGQTTNIGRYFALYADSADVYLTSAADTTGRMTLAPKGNSVVKIYGASGNVVIQNGGTFTDDGINRLQVSGSSRFIGNMVITGSGNTSATNALTVNNSSNSSLLFVRNDGNVGIGTNTPLNTLHINGTARVNYIIMPEAFGSFGAGGGITVYADYIYREGYSTTIARTLSLKANAGINFISNNTGQTAFLWQEDYATSTMYMRYGNDRSVTVGSNLTHTSSVFTIDSRTKGFLTPRMTAAQRLAITTPAQGLIVYDTGSATEGLWLYNSGSNPGWQQVLTNSGSQSISGSITVNNVTVTGTLTAQTIVAQTITSSTDYVSGSTIFGNSLSNTHQFTGSVSITGSLSLPYLSTGSVLFVGTGGAISQNNSNFFWDNANGRLGIGTNAPQEKLHINGTTRINNAINLFSGNQGYGQINSTSNGFEQIDISYGAGWDGTNWIDLLGSRSANLLRIGNSGLQIFNGSDQAGGAIVTFTEKLRVFSSTGNLVLQNGGTFIDNGQRLQVYGTTFLSGSVTGSDMLIRGSGNTSATNALSVVNSSNSSLLTIANNGSITVPGSTTFNSEINVQGISIGRGGNTQSTNTAIGVSALGANTSGTNNTALGRNALNLNTTGTSNTALGNGALQRITTGGGNIGIGYLAGYFASGSIDNQTSTNSIYIGNSTISSTNGNTNEIVIGTSGIGLGSNTTSIGNISTLSTWLGGNLLLGTTTSDGINRLQVSGSVAINGNTTITGSLTVSNTITAQTLVVQTITSSTDYVSGSTIFGNSLSNTHQFTGSVSITGSLRLPYLTDGSVLFISGGAISQNNSNFFWDNANGRLGIGTNSPAHALHVVNASSIRFERASTINFDILNTSGATNFLRLTANNGSVAIGTIQSIPLHFTMNASVAATLSTNNNFIVGLTSDSGERLQVSGSSRFMGNMVITGSDNTSATNALTIVNSSSANMFRFRNDSVLIFGGANTGIFCSTDKGQTITSAAGGLFLGYFATGDLGYVAVPSVTIGRPNNRLLNATSGTQIMGSVVGNYSPTSGTGLFTAFEVVPTINQTGGANGITRGLYVNPTLTANADFRAIEWSNNAATAPSASWGLYGTGTAPNLLNGSLIVNSSITASLALISGSGSQRLTVQGSGSSILTVDGALGRLFSVDDAASGSLFSVNTISGLPIMEAFSDNTVRVGQFGQRALFVSQSRVGIGKEDSLNATLDVSGSMALTGSFNHQGNYTTNGTITAQTLVISTISSSVVYSSGSNVFGNSLSNTQVLTGSVSITGSLSVNGGTVPLGAGAAGQVTYWTGTSAVSGSNNLFWDAANNRLGIGTNTPASILHLSQNYAGGVENLIPQFILENSNNSSGVNLSAILRTRISNGYTGGFPELWIEATRAASGLGFTRFRTVSNHPLSLWTNDSERVRVFAGGNVLIQSGGTFTDNGQRLQVIGDTLLRGSGSTSGTTALTVQNSSSVNLLTVRNDGPVFIHAVSNVATLYMSANGDSYFSKSTSGTNGVTLTGPASAHHTLTISSFNSDNYDNGALSSLRFSGNFVPSSGATAFSYMLINGTINQTGTSANIVRGLYVNPTITSATDFRAIEWSNNASATSGSWGLYGAGSAPNYLSGSLGIGIAPSESLSISQLRAVVSIKDSTTSTNSTTFFGAYDDFLQLSSNRNPSTGIFSNAGKATSQISLQGSTNSGSIYFYTTNTNNTIPVERVRITGTGNLLLGTTTDDTFNRLQVSGSTRISQAVTASQALISGSGTQRLTVVGSGSAQPLFTVQGSQGELFSIVDSLSGSLFSVNDQSGLPIMEVFSDNTTLVGNYLAPMLLTTNRTSSAAGINTIYSLSTSSYDAVYIDYTIRSGSNARAGNFMAMWSGTSVNFTDNSITEFGSTSAFTFGAHVSGANMVVTGSAPTAGWTIKTIIKAI